MKLFTIKTDENGTKKTLYPFTAIASITADLNPDLSSNYTKITLSDGTVLNVFESIDEIQELLNNSDFNDKDFVLTAYRVRSKREIYNN